MGIAFVSLVVNGSPLEADEDAKAGGETLVLDANAGARALEKDENAASGSEGPVADAYAFLRFSQQ